MIEKALFSFISESTEIKEIIGSSPVRMFPLFIPQKNPAKDQMPCIVYTVTSEQRQKTYCRTSPLVMCMVSLDFYALDIEAARALSTLVRNKMLDYRGLMGTLNVSDVSLENSMTQTDLDPGLMRVIDMYSIWYQEE